MTYQDWREERHTKQITPFLTPSLFTEVQRFAKENKVSVSEVVRASLSLFLATYSANDGEKYVSDRHAKAKKGKKAKKAVTA
jgi:Arc/MetJ-type ribon-helix-helix transcriptional regulator